MTKFRLARLAPRDMEAAAQVHRIAFDAAMPWLAGLHTPAEDQAFFRERVYETCELWGAFAGDVLVGIIAFREGSVEQLYVLPQVQGRGIGTALLAKAQSAFAQLCLWTFQRNREARRFYEARGFRLIEETDGARNEEREPDALYLWERP
jgi:GNAT superfamily N-acetyltransferase